MRMRLQRLGLSIVLAVGWFGCGLALAETSGITTAFGRDRSEKTDVVFLRNEDRLSGNVVGCDWVLETSFGFLKIEQNRLAALQFGIGETPDRLVTVNANLLVGRLERGPVGFSLSAGPVINLEPDSIETILFQRKEDEAANVPSRQYMRLRSGEVLTGRIVPDPFILRTPEGEISLGRLELAFLGPASVGRPFARAVLLDDRTVDGELLNKTFEVELDVGPSLQVDADAVDFIMGLDGQRPREPESEDGVRTVRVSSTKDVNAGLRGQPEEGGLRVVELMPASPFLGALQPDDLIIQVAGSHYGEGALTRAVWDMLAGNRDHVEVRFMRAGQEGKILLVRAGANEPTPDNPDKPNENEKPNF